MNRVETPNARLGALGWVLAGFFVVWVAWGFVLVRHPAISQGAWVRAAVRLVVWVLPAVLFIRRVEGRPFWETVGLADRSQLIRGMGWGLAGFAVVAALTAVLRLRVSGTPHWPTEVGTWVNPILGAPIAEEVFFRGLVQRVLQSRFGGARAVICAALLFALIHVPYWIMAGAMPVSGIATSALNVAVLGAWFGVLYARARSLAAPITCHGLNNLLSTVLG